MSVNQGEEVYVEFEPDNTVDKYGHKLFYLYRVPDGMFVNLEIIRQGYGHTDIAYLYPFQCMELFQSYEKKAQELGKGLWSSVEPPPKKYVYVTPKRGGKRYHTKIHYGATDKVTLEEAKKMGFTLCMRCSPL